MRQIYYDKRFWMAFVAPAGLWLVVCGLYINSSVGWSNLSEFLPFEMAVLALGVILPIVLLALWFSISMVVAYLSSMSTDVERQGELVDGLWQELNPALETLRGSGNFSAESLAALLDLPGNAISAKENQNLVMDNLIRKLDLVAETSNAGAESLKNNISSVLDGLSVRMDAVLSNQDEQKAGGAFNEIRQQTALLGLISVVLNDINVSATRVLVQLMRKEERSNEEIREFVQGLVSAYSVGDRSVFFSVLQHQLADNAERISILQVLAGESQEVADDLSKIIMETKEITSMIKKFNNENIITILFDDSVLRTLNNVLEPHFNRDGTAINNSAT
jgi:hypothetical protein